MGTTKRAYSLPAAPSGGSRAKAFALGSSAAAATFTSSLNGASAASARSPPVVPTSAPSGVRSAMKGTPMRSL
jgi:hypothetical protein